ncbi:hypothetical protein FNV43_RR18253 [Rhamnella rubrinervis]|uniref:Uncharacterized protein n=1 Tax=Rhamnella rubrinervis TaxID=2594499 RepID=A0A8K0GY12_9ROSA|nr:hypothetical protein FNV43_RR18253 [Rhamnella rubrinervis]
MYNQHTEQCGRMETTRGILLQEMQKIWNEVGQPDADRDAMLLEIEEECLEVYRSKVDEAKKCRVQMQREIAKFQTEFTDTCLVMGEQPPHDAVGSLKNGLKTITSQLEDLRKRKTERKNQFFEIIDQLEKISMEICIPLEDKLYKMVVEEIDLSLKSLEELHKRLVEYQDEKKNRLKQVFDYLSTLNSLCLVLDVNFKRTICEIHPSLDDSKGAKDTSNDTIESLADVVLRLTEIKSQRWRKLQTLATSLLELWNLLDIPMEEQTIFQKVTSKVTASLSEVNESNMLSMDFLNTVELEVSRLESLKSSKLKELVLKKRLDLENVCREAHMTTEAFGAMEYSIEDMESRTINPAHLLEQIDLQIAKAKKEALSRKEILEKVEKWLAACQEERWLEEYNKDENRFSAGRGAHVTLKRAEMARLVINKIPAMVEALTSKTTAWEKEKGVEFLYDNDRFLYMLEQYNILRQEKELERQRQRDRKKLQGQLIAEHEVLYGSKASPSKSGKKAFRTLTGGASNRKLSLGGQMLQNSKPENAAPILHPRKKASFLNQKSSPCQFGGFATPSPDIAGRRLTQISSHSVKKHSSIAAKIDEIESPLVRKPFSPVSSRLSSKANIANFLEDQNRQQDSTMQRKLSSSDQKPLGTPSKFAIVDDDENGTPRTMPIPVPSTPSTMPGMVLAAKTPPTPRGSSGACPVDKSDEPVEYSFEELRSGFIQPKAYRYHVNFNS